MNPQDQKLFNGELVTLLNIAAYDNFKRANIWYVSNDKRKQCTYAYEYELLPYNIMPLVTQINDDTWRIDYKEHVLIVKAYYDGGFTIRYKEGIYNSFQEIITDLLLFY